MPYEERSDEELMKMLQNPAGGQNNFKEQAERGFKELYRRYYPVAYGFCFHYGLRHNDAVEAVQEAFINVFKYSAGYKPDRNFKPWFFKILFHKVQAKFSELIRHRHEDSDDHANRWARKAPA